MRLDIEALAVAGAVVWGGPEGFGSVIVVTLYALLDGAVTGAVFGWLYNLVAGKPEART